MKYISNSSVEFCVVGNDVYLDRARVGYVSMDEVVINGNRYRKSGSDIFCGCNRIGFEDSGGCINLNDGSIWYPQD